DGMRVVVKTDPNSTRWTFGDDPESIVDVLRETAGLYEDRITAFYVAPFVFEAFCVYINGEAPEAYLESLGAEGARLEFGYRGVPLEVDPTEPFISFELEEEAVTT